MTDTGQQPERVEVDEVAVAALFADMRDRKLLKWLFADADDQASGMSAYGYVDAPIGVEAQEDIAEAWRVILARHRLTALTEAGCAGVGERYAEGFATFAAPGDQQQDAWLLRFCDQDMREAIWTGPDAEAQAWEAWNRYAPAWNCYVFRLATLAAAPTTPAQDDDGEVLRLRCALSKIASCQVVTPSDVVDVARQALAHERLASPPAPATPAPDVLREALEQIAEFNPKDHPAGKWSEGVSEWNRLGRLVSGIARAALSREPGK